MKLQHLLYGFIIFLAVSFFSCKDDYDNYSTNSSEPLSFSVDTLSFDTLFSTIGSTTRNFMIYNRNRDPLLISSIGFLHGDRGFRMNVPPERRDENGNFINVRISARDSLFVFVEATLDENLNNVPQFRSDEIIFTTNGVLQRIIVEAYGQDVVIFRAKVFEESITLSNEKPYLVFDSLTVNEGVTLTIPAGTTFFMRNGSWFNVLGNIKAVGTQERPIVFRGHRMDYLLPDIPYDRVPGQWEGMWFASSSFDNEFEHAHIRNGMVAMALESFEPDRLKMKLKNSVLTNVNGFLLFAENSHIVVENSELSNASGALVFLRGGKYSFTQCTLANYLPSWNSMTATGQTVVVFNYTFDKENNKVALPVEVGFFNSIIYGSNANAGEYIIVKDTVDYPDTPMNYKFQNCLLLKKDGKNDGEKLIDCIFNKDPKFIKSTPESLDKSKYDYIFDFRLDSISPAISKGDRSIALPLPYDMNGIYRLGEKGPDIGAYQWIKKE
ncbi:MAG: hypothetical protein LBI82_01005 [Dysgonamonadaceae bacterium]|jgi:hypothetical protein|nr:hypothetical protein [Dysgonamonadaceae bacterium]